MDLKVFEQILSGFYRTTKNNADLNEKLGNSSLGLLRTSFGQTIQVEIINQENFHIKFEKLSNSHAP